MGKDRNEIRMTSAARVQGSGFWGLECLWWSLGSNGLTYIARGQVAARHRNKQMVTVADASCRRR